MAAIEDHEKSVNTVIADVRKQFDKLLAEPLVREGLDFIKSNDKQRIDEQIQITEIPAPPFEERERAEDFKQRFTALGLSDVYLDAEGNVVGLLKGSEEGPKLVVSAHLDTVFPRGYDAKVTIDDNGVIHAPGISDDAAGLAALLSIVKTLKETGIQTVGDILFVGTVGEEGRGDLRGGKYLFSTMKDIDGFISIDGDGYEKIIYLGLGSKRFEFTFKGPGGHSFMAFGDVPNPIHAMGRAIEKIANIIVPDEPRTTYSVSVISGGTSVNSIATEAVMQTDTRSVCPEQLEETVARLVNCAKMAVIEENDSLKIPWDSDNNICLQIEKIGDRPSGACLPDALHVQVAWAATEAIGGTPRLELPGSTDASIPINLGIPALTLGGGGKGNGIHSPQESFDPIDAYLAVQRAFLTILVFTGIAGKTDPLLPRKSGRKA